MSETTDPTAGERAWGQCLHSPGQMCSVSDHWPTPATPVAGDVEALARVLSGATPEFAARAAENHMAQARRLLASDWLAARLDAARREGGRIACTNCDADDLGCTACGAQGTLAVTR